MQLSKPNTCEIKFQTAMMEVIPKAVAAVQDDLSIKLATKCHKNLERLVVAGCSCSAGWTLA